MIQHEDDKFLYRYTFENLNIYGGAFQCNKDFLEMSTPFINLPWMRVGLHA
jgi:hypothetical protein